MSIPRHFSQALRTNLRARAVWPPTAAVALGDYGVFVGGVFSRLGNIRTDFGVHYLVEPGGHKAEKFQFHSDRSTHAGLQANASAVKGELSLALDSSSSFFVSLSEFDVERLQSPRALALALREVSGWSHLRYFVVWELFRGEDLVFFGSESGRSAIKIRGSNEDLRALQQVGTLGASLEFETSGDVGLQIRGAPGQSATFALNLFRVKLIGDPVAMSFDITAAPVDDEVIDFIADPDIPDDHDLTVPT